MYSDINTDIYEIERIQVKCDILINENNRFKRQ